jgi:hypothetical protein
MDVFKSVIIFKMSIIRIMLIKNDNRFKVRAACLLYVHQSEMNKRFLF